MAEKRMYWLKVSLSFFRDKVIKKLRSLPAGDTYTVIALEILLLALENDFTLVFEGVEDTFAEELALELGENPEAVDVTLRYLISKNWLQEVSEAELYALKSAEISGSETAAASRMRNKRLRDKVDTRNNVTQALHGSYDTVTLEIRDKREEIRDKIQEIENTSPELSQTPGSPVVVNIPLIDKTNYEVTEELVAQLRGYYPAIDVLAEIRKAAGWCVGNPKNRKTRRGVMKFLTSWLARAQDRARPSLSSPPAVDPLVGRDGMPTSEAWKRFAEEAAREDAL